MALPPEKIRTLPELVFDEEEHGYRKDQVRRVLTLVAPVADELESLQQRVADAEARTAAAEARLVEATQAPEVAEDTTPTPDYDETLRKTLLLAQQTADQVVADANTEATDLRRQAEADAAASIERARGDAAEIEAEAERRRVALDEELAAERARRLSEIAAEADSRLQQVRQSLDEVEGSERASLRDEVTALAASRQQLTTDVETLEGHLAERRETIRQALADLDAALDDPARMRPAMPPTVSDASAPSGADDGVLRVDAVDAIHRDAAAASDAAAGSTVLDADVVAEAPDAGVAIDVDPGSDTAADAVAEPAAVATLTEEIVDDVTPDEPTLETDGDLDAVASVADEQIVLGDAEPTLGLDDDQPTEMVDVVAADAPTERAPGSSLVTGALPVPDPAVADTGVVEALSDATPASDGPLWADEADDTTLASPAAAASAAHGPTADPFLEELRRVTSDDAGDSDDEALHAFFNTEEEEKRGWFGRKKS